MSKQVSPLADGDKIPQKSKKKQTTLKDKVRKHITDINDVISDEDIRDAQPDTVTIENEVEKKKKELEKNSEVNEGNEKEGKKPITPWDVLDE
jgi:hypothetical protein